MDYNKVKSLLDKYWKCETSLEEEVYLKNYFENQDVPDDLQPYIPLFRYYRNVSEIKTSEEFSPASKPVTKRATRPEKINPWFSRNTYYRAAAIALIILSLVIIRERMVTVKEQAIALTKDTFTDPRDALKETKKMLLLISSKMNKGESQAIKISEFHKAETMFRKNEN